VNGYSRVLGAVLLIPVFETFGDVLEHALLPSVSARLAIHALFLLAALGVVAVAIRGADRPMTLPPLVKGLLIAFVALATVGGTAGTFFMAYWTTLTVGQQGAEAVARWNESTISVSLALMALRTVGLVGLFIYGAVRRSPA
jgi:hypothetical protein